jgi:hypothetical protein
MKIWSGAVSAQIAARSVHQQGFRQHTRQHRIRSRRSAESALEPLPLPDRRAEDVPPREDLAERANQPGNAVPGDKWASLIPFARVADLLKEVLPVGDSLSQETIRNHLYTTGERIEMELGEERQLNLFEGSEEDWEQ